ncbi:MAG: hypothetical protein NZ551_02840 [Microscillaceae bacterium]|nr:hypothetical protein [Microscillaceae bacterium]MDW8460124.1 hypothetical protein [Cytophagales bacterium]
MNKFLSYFSEIEQKIIEAINSQKELLNEYTINSPRAVGDAIQDFLAKEFLKFIPVNFLKDYSETFARRAMADFAFMDNEDNFYAIDCKTHNIGTHFNMPNLTSVERISRFYEDRKNYFVLLMIAYQIENQKLIAQKCIFSPIEHIDWSCLTIGALGWGQIQIANSNHILVNKQLTRKTWMLQLCEAVLAFYPREIAKINDRINYFEKMKQFWDKQSDV